jgi:hypothetical protein
MAPEKYIDNPQVYSLRVLPFDSIECQTRKEMKVNLYSLWYYNPLIRPIMQRKENKEARLENTTKLRKLKLQTKIRKLQLKVGKGMWKWWIMEGIVQDT